ncbi:hypothetical protein TBLA_0G00650 [Henningerozyma blattae CBS 6284]|uniref:ENTH domain-containing protein n=1 Tax=Henningerozyma blattae (strain ATCC 34711 / CBS 6284 / DSM 70876 / NBRC 10599 / NRRL Y-10934 / UCD 77-7) TaxID=1071380 RepID=I2H6L1_HENB6|nr:hypothetical protein TBLA_0G00650 [Tetrapisispora blattae CBS 6284]CCH62013.1 hypothetical protein TBLA_0G00650 [Tetrapisispora blattae CBS 6284]
MAIFESVRNFVQSPTELKVRTATDDNENSGATGTLMNEISVLTYSTKTNKEIVTVLKKRLTGYGKKSSHRNCIHIIKTLTLIAYLMNNGSLEFIRWINENQLLFEVMKNFEVSDTIHDEKFAIQIRDLSERILELINNRELLEQKRNEVDEFRSSISSPGRKSTDNSHIRKSTDSLIRKSLGERSTNFRSSLDEMRKSSMGYSDNPNGISNGSCSTANSANSNNSNLIDGNLNNSKYIGGLDLRRSGSSSRRNTHEYGKFGLDTLTEEDHPSKNDPYIYRGYSNGGNVATSPLAKDPTTAYLEEETFTKNNTDTNTNANLSIPANSNTNNLIFHTNPSDDHTTTFSHQMSPEIYASLAPPPITTSNPNTNPSANPSANPITNPSTSTCPVSPIVETSPATTATSSSSKKSQFSVHNPFRTLQP